MHSVIPLLATLPPGFLWAIVVLVTLAFPLVPFFVVRALQISDERKQEIQERVASLPETGAIDEVVLLTVEDWPSMDEVVYEDASTGPTPVGFEFKADTVAGDVESALKSRGIQVRTMDIREVESNNWINRIFSQSFIQLATNSCRGSCWLSLTRLSSQGWPATSLL